MLHDFDRLTLVNDNECVVLDAVEVSCLIGSVVGLRKQLIVIVNKSQVDLFVLIIFSLSEICDLRIRRHSNYFSFDRLELLDLV